MDDLINRESLLAGIEESIVFSGRPGIAFAEISGANKIIDRIKAAPTVDAVPVVRCDDCIGKSIWYNDAEYGFVICGMSGMYPKSEHDYCSYGERKDNETD